MIKNILILSIVFCINFASVYGVGDIVSNAHQNISKDVCWAGNDYHIGDRWKLLDWNGTANGGHYNVIFIEMSATW